MSILTEPRNALVKQFTKLLELEGVKLTVEEDALKAMVERAMHLDTGARSLRSVLENTMNDLMFQIPGMKNVIEVIITRETVEKHTMPQIIKEPARRKKAS